MLNRLLAWLSGFLPKSGLKVYTRSQHGISRQNISNNALKVLYRLHNNGYRSLLVGGCLRDLLVGVHPKDFDIVTNAQPEQVKESFSNCRLIGRRFRLAHVHFGREIIEVATFRAYSAENQEENQHGMIVRDNTYGTIEQDVMRRDFTINSLYYDINDYAIYDYVNGFRDIKNKIVRLIGNPYVRYREDPVRMLRAIRFAIKLKFKIEYKTSKAIFALNQLIENVPAARMFEEYIKLFLKGEGYQTFQMLHKYKLLTRILPVIKPYVLKEPLYTIALQNTDDRVKTGKSVAPGFLLGVLLWPAMQNRRQELINEGMKDFMAQQQAIDEVISANQKKIAIPRRFLTMIRDVWELQPRLHKRHGRIAAKLFNLGVFRAAYDFLLLRAEAGDAEALPLANWWKEYIASDPEERKRMAAAVKPDKRKPRRKYVRKKKASKEQST